MKEVEKEPRGGGIAQGGKRVTANLRESTSNRCLELMLSPHGGGEKGGGNSFGGSRDSLVFTKRGPETKET